MNFCPHCGQAAVTRMVDGRERDVCPAGHYIQFARTSLGVGAMIVRDNRALLVQRGTRPVGLWTLVSGYVEEDERLDEAIVREVKEEIGLDVTPRGLLFVRNMHEHSGNNIYSVFLCDVSDDATPQPDGHEALDARFFSVDALQTLDDTTISPYARWFVTEYLEKRMTPWTYHATGFDEPSTRIYTGSRG